MLRWLFVHAGRDKAVQAVSYTHLVTYLAITQDKDGNFKFVVAEGENQPGPIFTFGDTKMCIRDRLITFRRKFTSGDLTSRHVYRMLRAFVGFANIH